MQKRHLNEAYASSQRATSLVSELLSVSRLDLGELSVDLSDVDVAKTLKAVIKDLKVLLDQKNLKIKCHIDNIPRMNLDKRLLTVILQNLLTNSINYTPKGGKIDVKVSVKKSYILIATADSGIGIAKSEQSHVFDKLYRTENAKAFDPNHTGLGLYITKAMVERLGGDIWLKSAAHKGTTFYVKLPLAKHRRRIGNGHKGS